MILLNTFSTFPSGQVDSQLQITGSILQPNISGNIKLSHGEAYLPHDRGGAPASNRFPSNESMLPSGGVSQVFASRYVSRFFSSESPASAKTSQSSGSGIALLIHQYSLTFFTIAISVYYDLFSF